MSNNKKLPLGLKMTEDGQNIDLGRGVADQVRMVTEMASDPKYAEQLKEIGKQYGYDNMTAEQFQKIGEEIAAEMQFETNRFIPGTESHRLDSVAQSINSSTSSNNSGTRLESAQQDKGDTKRALQNDLASLGGNVQMVNAEPEVTGGGGGESDNIVMDGDKRHDSHDFMVPKFGLVTEMMTSPAELM